ncbi:LysR family transcriptional regulator [Serratia fonticola]|uniref:LysR substrate-binding domain-containing protein n=1 Tax=Serratia fonticola TaxID=47917 RepID=UPI0015C60E33|nr:LysR substrate-binding domain-containing protein [Serratia fonticola]MBC3378335.1 LysR family transcriptional regulator [Serratia fonticola]NYA37535.1 LysR family transcriptional regulator [Serratia fonticola]
MIKLQQMKIFQMVASLGSIRAAASALHLTQPALTRSLKELEAALDVNLIIRGSGGITLTEAGKVFKFRIEKILNDIESTQIEVRDTVKFRNRSVSFGFSSSLAYTVLPETIRCFKNHFPKTNIIFAEEKLSELLPKTRNGELDFCITTSSDTTLIDDFICDYCFSLPFCIIARKGHPLEKSLTIKELARADWCLPSNFFVNNRDMESFIYQNEFSKNVITGNSSETRINMVLNANCLSIVPAVIFNETLFKDNLTTIHVKEKIPSVLYSVMYHNELRLSPEAKWLIAEFKYSIRQHCDYWDSQF